MVGMSSEEVISNFENRTLVCYRFCIEFFSLSSMAMAPIYVYLSP
jgi:hypothetical protein